MCEFCNIQKGDCEELVAKEIPIQIGNRVLRMPHLMQIFIGHEDDGYSLSADYFMDNGDAAATVELSIKYCPICGRNLQ